MQPTKATEGSREKGDTHTQAKPTQSPRKPQYSQRGRPRGSKEREDAHTQAKKPEPRRPQYSQQRRPRETHSNQAKKDRNEESPTTLPIRPLAPHWTVTAGSEPRRSLALSKTALKSPHSIVGTDGSAKSRHEVKNSSRSGFRLGA